jgi:hypothetical protein
MKLWGEATVRNLNVSHFGAVRVQTESAKYLVDFGSDSAAMSTNEKKGWIPSDNSKYCTRCRNEFGFGLKNKVRIFLSLGNNVAPLQKLR